MSIKITTPNGGSDSLDFGCARTAIAATVTGTEVSSGEGKLELKTTTGGTSATKVTVLANGDVGIGTSPECELHVFKDSSGASTDGSAVAHFESSGSTVLQVSAGTSNDCHIAFGDSGNQNIGSIAYLNNGNHMAFRADNGEKMRITGAGNVGIGTSSPIAKLTTDSGDIAISSTQASDNGDLGEFQFWNRTNAGSGSGTSFVNDVAAIQGQMEGTGNNSGGSLHFHTKADGATKNEVMRLEGTGSLKATSPASTTGLQPFTIDWLNENNAGIMASIGCDRTASSAAPGDLVFRTSTSVDSGAISEKMRITSAGALTLASPASSNLAITKSTTQATTSGTAFDFGSIPAGVNRVCIMFRGVSLSSSAHHLIQLSTGGTVLTSGYVSSSYWGGGGESATNGMVWYGGNNAARTISGIMTLQHMGGNIWVNSHTGKYMAPTCMFGGGDVDLGGVLDGIRVTNDATGSNTYDAGAINISWEF